MRLLCGKDDGSVVLSVYEPAATPSAGKRAAASVTADFQERQQPAGRRFVARNPPWCVSCSSSRRQAAALIYEFSSEGNTREFIFIGEHASAGD